MRLLSTVLILLASLAAGAHSVDTPVESLTYHYRVLIKSSSETEFGIVWNATDSLNYRYATVRTYGAAAEDSWGETITLTLGQKCDGRDSVLRDETLLGELDMRRSGISLRIDASPAGALLSVGSKKAIASFPIDYDCSLISEIHPLPSSRTEILRNDLTVVPLAPAEYAPFASHEALKEHLRASADPYEGFWRYFDRDTDPLRATLGGNYCLATVKTEQGYSIIYISGAQTLAEQWKPLRIKGHLTPTFFAGAFDLLCFEPSGRTINFETSATFENNLLTLSLPYWDSTVRFSRINPNDI